MKLWSVLSLSLLSACLFSNRLIAESAPTPTQVIIKCDTFPAPYKGGYCIHKPEKSTNSDIVYYLHGLNNSEKTWQEATFYPQQIRDYWTAHQLDFPTVVSISFGDLWILAEKNGLLAKVTDSVIPEIEKGLGGLKGRRILIGESMGGFNSIQLALKTTLFKKAALLCSPMGTITPFASDAEVQAFIEKSDAWSYYKDSEPDTVKTAVAQMLQLSHFFYPTEEDWKKADPLVLSQQSDPKKAPDLYVAVGFYDKYASYEANQEFAKTLSARGFNLEWRPQWGGHCSIDIPTVSRFLVSK